MKRWKLARTRQCAKCPWKKSTNPYDIPRYELAKHRALQRTIKSGELSLGDVTMMACHESRKGHEYHCVGWLMNQLGPGNNIGLRMRMLDCENLRAVELDGEQHESFAATLPRDPMEGLR